MFADVYQNDAWYDSLNMFSDSDDEFISLHEGKFHTFMKVFGCFFLLFYWDLGALRWTGSRSLNNNFRTLVYQVISSNTMKVFRLT